MKYVSKIVNNNIKDDTNYRDKRIEEDNNKYIRSDINILYNMIHKYHTNIHTYECISRPINNIHDGIINDDDVHDDDDVDDDIHKDIISYTNGCIERYNSTI